MSETPTSAPVVRLGEIARIVSGGTPSRANPAYWGGIIPWVKTGNVRNDRIGVADIDERITETGLTASSARVVPAGTILMAMYGQGGTRGRVSVLELDAAINQACAAILVRDGIDRDYVFQVLRHKYAAIRRLSNSGGQENLSVELLRSIALPLPAIADQQRIAATLGTWDSAIDTTERLIAAQARRMDGLQRHLLHSARAASWPRERLKSLARVKKGQQLNGTDMISNGQFYVLNGGIGPSGRTSESNTPADTITISEGGNSCGFVSYNRGSFWCGGHCYALLNLAGHADVRYVYHFLKSQQHRIMSLRTGSGLPNIAKSEVEDIVIVVPPLAEQRRVVTILHAAEHEIAILRSLRAAYKNQKRALMSVLFSSEGVDL